GALLTMGLGTEDGGSRRRVASVARCDTTPRPVHRHGAPRCPYEVMPFAVHSAAYAPVHRSEALTKPSATTSFTLSLKMALGTSSLDWTSLPVWVSFTVVRPETDLPWASASARSEAPWASCLIAL